jgi:hypothetical protein
MQIDMWTTHSLDKLFPESERPPGAGQTISLKAARNETEDAQVVVRIPKGTEIASASFSLPELVRAEGGVIPKEHLSASWIWYTYVLSNPPQNRDPSSYLRKAPAFFPDAFLEDREIRIRDEWTQPLWVSVRVPEGTPAGEYRGDVEVHLVEKEGGEHTLRVPITLMVWPFTLPAKGHLHHTEWYEAESLAQYYRLEPWSEAHWQWIERMAADMAAHRQDMFLTHLTELVRVKRTKTGDLSFDFSRFDRWVRTFREAGLDWIEGSWAATRVAGFRSQIVWQRFPVYGPDGETRDESIEKLSHGEFETYAEQFLKAVYTHLRRQGWDKQYVQHISDEPVPENKDDWCRCAGKVREWLPGVPIIDAVMSEGLEGYIDWRVPQIQHTGPEVPRHESEELWSYVCLEPQGQYPNRFLDYPSIRNRIIFWLSWSLGLKGFLHWGYNYWVPWEGVPARIPVSPWLDATGASIYCADREPLPAGDPHIVYPGEKQICSSIRWEVVRKGLEDFEYLYLLEHAVESAPSGRDQEVAAARELLERVRGEIARDPLNHTRDDAALLSVREEAGELLSLLAAED